ncbi:MAG TPA: tetratricopeptide repeat protein, partial [Bacteroidia bacterium]|nr:tetratricopeptide repeat protein [Bacteroidia bacterium]
GLPKQALAALDEAIALAPTNTEYQTTRADLYIEQRQVGDAISQLETIREQKDGLQERAEVDQRLFSLLRGHYATKAEQEKSDLGILQQGGIESLAQYRRLAAAASQSAARSGDEPPPKEL